MRQTEISLEKDEILSFTFFVKREGVLASQRACGSRHPLHTKSKIAKRIGFKGIIVPATMILENAQSQLCDYIARKCGYISTATGADDIRLGNCAYPGKPITIKATVTDKKGPIIKVRFYCLQRGKSCLDGVSTFLLRKI